MTAPDRNPYLVAAAALLAVYAVTATLLALTRDFEAAGPLAFDQPALTAPMPGGIGLDEALDRCFPTRDRTRTANTFRVVGGQVEGRALYGCFEVTPTGAVFGAAAVDATQGLLVTDIGLLKRAGIWPWVGLVKTTGELVLGGIGLAAILLLGWRYYAVPRPGPPAANQPWWTTRPVLVLLALVPLAGWAALAVWPGLSRARRSRVLLQTLWGWAIGLLASLSILLTSYPDAWGLAVVGLLWVGTALALVGGRRLVAPAGFGAPEDAARGGPPATTPQPMPPPSPAPVPSPAPAPPPAPAGTPAPAAPYPGGTWQPGGDGDGADAAGDLGLRVVPPDALPSFAHVGGMEPLKAELRDTVGLMLAFADEAATYRITWNGLLLHGPPGVGKTFVARAVAGEFGMHFLPVTTGDLLSAYAGQSARNVQAAFRAAAGRIPCLLFFDEFDSVAISREDQPDQEARRTVNELLQALEQWRDVDALVVVAATNHLDRLDPAVVRAGRFDRHVRIDLPDHAARAAIFRAQLRDRPVAGDVDAEELARRTEGFTPATITQIVQGAALAAFRQAAATGELGPITMRGLLGAIQARGGQDRPTIEGWTWERLILAEDTKRELQQIQHLLTDPDRARAFGVAPPSGLLLAGPPGTGKTTIARVLAAQAGCSFYPITAADITSKWVGESEQRIKRLFARARENAPSIVFIDEIDAVAGTRGGFGPDDRQLTQLLAEIDGLTRQRGVFVLGATNRPEDLDPALLRGGRLSRTIWVPLPDQADRRRLLEVFTGPMPLTDVDLDALARDSEGLSGADLEALCQQAAIEAMVHAGPDGRTVVTGPDFDRALRTMRESKAVAAGDEVDPALMAHLAALLHEEEH
jgi:transitional endoplasmic reticulum ATPase